MTSSAVPAKPTSHAPYGGSVQLRAAWNQRFDANQPERRDGDEQGSRVRSEYSARPMPGCRCRCPGSETKQRRLPQLTAARQVCAARQRNRGQNRAGKQKSDGHHEAGGNDSTAMRMPRYVVPQNTQTHASAAYAFPWPVGFMSQINHWQITHGHDGCANMEPCDRDPYGQSGD